MVSEAQLIKIRKSYRYELEEVRFVKFTPINKVNIIAVLYDGDNVDETVARVGRESVAHPAFRVGGSSGSNT